MITAIAAVARIGIGCSRIIGIGSVCRIAGCRSPSGGSGGGCAGAGCSFLEAGELLGEVVFAVHLRFSQDYEWVSCSGDRGVSIYDVGWSPVRLLALRQRDETEAVCRKSKKGV